MPIDAMMLDPMLGTYRNMVAEIHQKDLTGEDVDQMVATLARMEQLGQEHSDFAAFSGQLMQENLFGKFSDHYGRALSSAAQAAQSDGGDYNDAALLKQSVDALRQAIQTIRQSYQDQINTAKSYDPHAATEQAMAYAARSGAITDDMKKAGGTVENMTTAAHKNIDQQRKDKPNAFDDSVEVEVLNNPELIIQPIEDLVALGEQAGMTLPRFLRLQIEQGLDKAAEGAGQTRQALERAVDWIKANPPSPFHLEKAESQKRVYDELASKQAFGVPNAKQVSYAHDDIDRHLQPKINEWDAIKKRWEDLLYDLSHWSLSYTSYAPFIEPWSMARDPNKAVKRTQDITPGLFKQREMLLHKYFAIDFMSIFKHPSFWWEVQWDYIGYSQEFVQFLIERVYPQCVPFQHLDADTIAQRQIFYGSKTELGREGNPGASNPPKRAQQHYDGLFGQGRFVSKFGQISEPQTAAAPWNWETFKYRE